MVISKPGKVIEKNLNHQSFGKVMKISYIHRALKCHALSVRLTHFGLTSRTHATHRISHAEKNSRLFNVLMCRSAQT